VIQLAVRAAEAAESPPAADRMSNVTAVDDGVWVDLAADAAVDADGVPQAIASNNSDAIAAVRFIWIHGL